MLAHRLLEPLDVDLVYRLAHVTLQEPLQHLGGARSAALSVVSTMMTIRSSQRHRLFRQRLGDNRDEETGPTVGHDPSRFADEPRRSEQGIIVDAPDRHELPE